MQKTIVMVIGVIGALATIVLLLVVLAKYQTSRDAAPNRGVDRSKTLLWTNMPGVDVPKLSTASEINLADDSEVIGVEVNGESRAYPLHFLGDLRRQIVNDVIGDTPVSVTYCAHADSVRVLTSRATGKPIDLHFGGLDMNERMICLLDGVRYQQTSRALPLADYKFERTTWGKWKSQHESSLVYAGEFERRTF